MRRLDITLSPSEQPAPRLPYPLTSADQWTPACGGTETPFVTRSGKRVLYCWNRATGKHAYLDCGTDIIMTDEEARAALGTY